eukprot:scaffold17750_cov80-Skeletonema_menzelii.AAC.2
MANDDGDNGLVNLSKADIHYKIDVAATGFIIHVLETGVPYEGGYFIFHQQAMAVIKTLRKQIDKNRFRSVRGIYYVHAGLFYSYEECRSFLNNLLPRMKLEMCHVNIIPEVKGTIVTWKGIKFRFNKGHPNPKVDETFCYAPLPFMPTWPIPSALGAFYKIPVDEENEIDDELADDVFITTLEMEVDDGQGEPEFLLVSEKSDYIDELIREGFFDDHRAIAICSKGYATHNTYALVKMLHKKWPSMKIIAFNDASPSGLDICMRFYFMNTTKGRFSVPIIWGGLLISDIIDHDEILNAMVTAEEPLNDWDRTCLQRISEHPWYKNSVQSVDIYNQIHRMTTEGKKWEMNAFDPPGGSISKFVSDRLKDGTYMLGPVAELRDE